MARQDEVEVTEEVVGLRNGCTARQVVGVVARRHGQVDVFALQPRCQLVAVVSAHARLHQLIAHAHVAGQLLGRNGSASARSRCREKEHSFGLWQVLVDYACAVR